MTERRSSDVLPLSTRAAAPSGGTRISGLAVPFYPGFADIGGAFIEVVDPHAFDAQAAAQWRGSSAVEGRYQHVDSFLLCSTRTGTMTLEVTPKGLNYTMLVPDSAGLPVDLVATGDVAGASIGFSTLRDSWMTLPDGTPVRTLHEVTLIEVSLVGNPAFRDTTATITGRSAQTRAGKVLSGSSKSKVKAAMNELQALLEAAGELDPDPDTEPIGEQDSIGDALEEDSVPAALEKDSANVLIGKDRSSATIAEGRKVLARFGVSPISDRGRFSVAVAVATQKQIELEAELLHAR